MCGVRDQGSAVPAAACATGPGRCATRGNAAGARRAVQSAAAGEPDRSREEKLSAFVYRDGELHVENMPLSAIAAQFGTPCYVYSRASLEGAFREFDQAFAGVDHLVCYALKANSNLAILDLFARLGGGFDIVSGGEL